MAAITWKDAITTILAAGTGALAYAKYLGWQSWVTAPRLGIAVLAVVGIAMCALGAGNTITAGSPWSIILSAMGGLALVLVIAGLITGSSFVFYALTADILALWLLSTIRHLAG
jgi:hypothetical protein